MATYKIAKLRRNVFNAADTHKPDPKRPNNTIVSLTQRQEVIVQYKAQRQLEMYVYILAGVNNWIQIGFVLWDKSFERSSQQTRGNSDVFYSHTPLFLSFIFSLLFGCM